MPRKPVPSKPTILDQPHLAAAAARRAALHAELERLSAALGRPTPTAPVWTLEEDDSGKYRSLPLAVARLRELIAD